jgi:hypothetical protein
MCCNQSTGKYCLPVLHLSPDRQALNFRFSILDLRFFPIQNRNAESADFRFSIFDFLQSKIQNRKSKIGRIALAASIALLLSSCGPTRCLNVNAFGNLGPEINSPYDDYAPALSDTATLVFTSNRVEPGEGGLRQFYRSIRPTRLFFSMRLAEEWDSAQVYRLFIEGESSGEGATIGFAPPGSPFGTIAYLSACERSDTIGGCDLYAVTERQSATLVNLGATVNSPAWDGHPFVTADGSTLYFASDRPGGEGGTDIWVSSLLPSGAWGTPRNAGPAVNTSTDELSPFFDAASGKLYFAAQSPNTGLDIYILDRGADSRQMLLPPYNSEYDDFTPYLIDGTFYLASNRGGGCGGYDLYGFEMREARTGE